MHFSIFLYHVSMHYWKDSSGMPSSSVVTALLMVFMSSKQLLLMIPIELGEKKKVVWDKIRWIGRLFQFVHVFLGQDQQVAWCCEQVYDHSGVATICPATTLISSYTLRKGSCRLAGWSSGPVVRTCCRWYPSYWKMWSTWLSFDFVLPSGIIFYLLTSLLKLLCHSKTCVQHSVISIHLKHFKC